jgi:RNA polymerase sigma-70 factor (ECF subfamily)
MLSRMVVDVNDDVISFNELERCHRASVQSFVLKRTGNLHLSEEIAQETFVRAWNSRLVLLKHDNPRAWLFTVARNLITDHYRKSARVVAKESKLRLLASETSSEERSSYEDSEILQEMLKVLSKEHRDVLECCVIQGFSTKEAANILKVPSGTVKSRLFYALKELRQHLVTKESIDERA